MIVNKIRATISTVLTEKISKCDELGFEALQTALSKLKSDVSMINGVYQIRLTRMDKKSQLTRFISKQELALAVAPDELLRVVIEEMLKELFGKEMEQCLSVLTVAQHLKNQSTSLKSMVWIPHPMNTSTAAQSVAVPMMMLYTVTDVKNSYPLIRSLDSRVTYSARRVGDR